MESKVWSGKKSGKKKNRIIKTIRQLLFGCRFLFLIMRCSVHKPDSAGYHHDGKKILPFQFFVKQQGSENNAQHRNQCEKEAHTCKYDFSTQIRGRNRKLFVADFDKRVCQRPSKCTDDVFNYRIICEQNMMNTEGS